MSSEHSASMDCDPELGTEQLLKEGLLAEVYYPVVLLG